MSCETTARVKSQTPRDLRSVTWLGPAGAHLVSGAACCWGVCVVVIVAIFSALVSNDAFEDSEDDRNESFRR